MDGSIPEPTQSMWTPSEKMIPKACVQVLRTHDNQSSGVGRAGSKCGSCACNYLIKIIDNKIIIERYFEKHSRSTRIPASHEKTIISSIAFAVLTCFCRAHRRPTSPAPRRPRIQPGLFVTKSRHRRLRACGPITRLAPGRRTRRPRPCGASHFRAPSRAFGSRATTRQISSVVFARRARHAGQCSGNRSRGSGRGSEGFRGDRCRRGERGSQSMEGSAVSQKTFLRERLSPTLPFPRPIPRSLPGAGERDFQE